MILSVTAVTAASGAEPTRTRPAPPIAAASTMATPKGRARARPVVAAPRVAGAAAMATTTRERP